MKDKPSTTGGEEGEGSTAAENDMIPMLEGLLGKLLSKEVSVFES